MTTGSGKWEREVDEIISKFYPPTKIEGQNIDNTPLSEQSFFDVWELDLDRDNKEKPLIISGNDAFIALQASLLRALDQLLSARGLQPFVFEEWKESFESGFNTFTTGASELLKKQWEQEIYPGIKKENAPKIVEIKLDGRKKKLADFRVVQFFPDRKSPGEWLLFSGSYREIAGQITNWWNQKTEGGTSANKSDVIKRSGHPEVTLFFRQEEGFEAGFQPIKGQISFDLMELTDNPSVAEKDKNLKLITKKDIERLGKKISSIFRTEPPYKWSKGKKQVNYHDWVQGYSFIIYCSSFEEGARLASSVLSIQGHKINEEFLKHGEAKNPVKAYPAPSEVTVLEKKHRTARLRPSADVVYQYAKLYLPTIRESQVIA